MVDDFLRAIQTGSQPMSTLADGLWASRIAIAAYESVAQANQPVAVR
jgi:predicted dehydrogenase